MNCRPVVLAVPADSTGDSWRKSLSAVEKLNYDLVLESPDVPMNEAIEKTRPDVILLAQNGHSLERVRDIRQAEKLAHVPIFLVTDHVPLEDLPTLIEAGIDDCLREGTPEALMRSRLAAAVRRRLDEQYALIVAKETPVRDSLTGLWNHRHFHELLRLELNRAQRSHGLVSLLMLDLDRFKWINDTFGHQAGDLCLRDVSLALTSALRSGDIVARYGGEEFAVILPATDRATAFQVGRRLRREVRRRTIPVEKQKMLSITLSAGIAVYPDDAANAGDLVRAADVAMYQAKRRGRDRMESVRACRFTFHSTRPVDFVGVGGDWNAWSPEASPLRLVEGISEIHAWEGTVLLPTGRNRYKFKTLCGYGDETSYLWMPDPGNELKEPDGFGGVNSFVDVESYEAGQDEETDR